MEKESNWNQAMSVEGWRYCNLHGRLANKPATCYSNTSWLIMESRRTREWQGLGLAVFKMDTKYYS